MLRFREGNVMPNRAMIWVDYAEACVGRIDPEISGFEIIESYRAEAGSAPQSRSLKAPETLRYFGNIAEKVRDAEGILLVGPGSERLELLVYLRRNFPHVADRIVALEAADHPTEEAVLPWARKHFGTVETV